MKNKKNILYPILFLGLVFGVASCNSRNEALSDNSSIFVSSDSSESSSEEATSSLISSEEISSEESSEVSSEISSETTSEEPSTSVHSHNYQKEVVKPTCEEQGYDHYECECGDEYNDNYVDALDHSYGDWVLVNEPEEFMSGLLTRTCANDENHVEEHILPLLYESEEYIKTYLCGSQEIYSYTYIFNGKEYVFVDESVEGELCDYEQTIVPPTCEEDGYTLHVCSVCGDRYTSNIVSSTGEHVYIEDVIEPTCEEQGYTIYECGCGDSYIDDYVKKLDHDYQKEVVEPTCEQQGYDHYECECGDEYKDNYVDALDHSYGNWEVSVEPTINTTGVLVKTCARDSTHLETKELPKLNETDYTYVLVEDSTCEEEGLCTYSYVIDNQTFVFEVIIELKDHELVKTTILPTCEEQGYDLHECENCDYEYRDNYVRELGHSFEEELSWDETHHYYSSTCGHDVKKDVAEHNFIMGVCDSCDYYLADYIPE